MWSASAARCRQQRRTEHHSLKAKIMKVSPKTAFIRGCSTGKAATVKSLLEGGLDPETRDHYHLTGLIWAGRKGRVEVAKVLLAHGVEIDATDVRGRTALYHAVTYKRYELVEYLAAAGANLSPIDTHGWTPLDFAMTNTDIKMVDLLHRLGARCEFRMSGPPKPNGARQRKRTK